MGLGLGSMLGPGLGVLGLGLECRAVAPGPPTRHAPLSPVVHKLVARAATAAPARRRRTAARPCEVLREEETCIRNLLRARARVGVRVRVRVTVRAGVGVGVGVRVRVRVEW